MHQLVLPSWQLDPSQEGEKVLSLKKEIEGQKEEVFSVQSEELSDTLGLVSSLPKRAQGNTLDLVSSSRKLSGTLPCLPDPQDRQQNHHQHTTTNT